MSASIYRSGSGGTAALGTTELSILRWRVTPVAQLNEFRNSKSGTCPIREASFKDCLVELDLDFDFANNPLQSPVGISVGAVLNNAKLCLHQSVAGALDGPAWSFTALVVDSTPQELLVDGKITTRVTAKPSGSFGGPG